MQEPKVVSQLLIMAAAAIVASPVVADSADSQPVALTHMPESLRSSFKTVVVLPGQSPGRREMSGSYGKPTAGLLGGAMQGSTVGNISKEIGGVRVGFPIRILTIPGAIVGGLIGGTKRQVQDFRDRLTVDLAQASGRTLSNEKLSSDVFWGLRRLPGLESKVLDLSVPIPADTDAVLYVSLTDVTINIDGKDAVITTTASSTLRRMSDGAHVYEKTVEYQDRDTLSNWTKNDNALWRDYTNFARHYLGREIVAESFDRVELKHELVPKNTKSVKRVRKNNWQGVSRTLSPTLAWELTLQGDDAYGPWVNDIELDSVAYDVEIYDAHRRIYAAKRVQDSQHTVTTGLEACQTYRWSVRPSYRVGEVIKFGEWMRSSAGTEASRGNVGRKLSESPAYLQDFASLKIKCGSK